MATTAEILAKVDDLLKKGDVAGAQAALLEKPSDAAGPAEPPPPPVKRKPEEVLIDLFKAFNNILGNHPAPGILIKELEDLTAPENVPPTT